jgi:hypothetical protein
MTPISKLANRLSISYAHIDNRYSPAAVAVGLTCPTQPKPEVK